MLSSCVRRPCCQEAQWWMACRLHRGPEAAIAYAQIGMMFSSAKQHGKAAHYYRQNIMANKGGIDPPGPPGGCTGLRYVASAFDWLSVHTGDCMLCTLCWFVFVKLSLHFKQVTACSACSAVLCLSSFLCLPKTPAWLACKLHAQALAMYCNSAQVTHSFSQMPMLQQSCICIAPKGKSWHVVRASLSESSDEVSEAC